MRNYDDTLPLMIASTSFLMWAMESDVDHFDPHIAATFVDALIERAPTLEIHAHYSEHLFPLISEASRRVNIPTNIDKRSRIPWSRNRPVDLTANEFYRFYDQRTKSSIETEATNTIRLLNNMSVMTALAEDPNPFETLSLHECYVLPLLAGYVIRGLQRLLSPDQRVFDNKDELRETTHAAFKFVAKVLTPQKDHDKEPRDFPITPFNRAALDWFIEDLIRVMVVCGFVRIAV